MELKNHFQKSEILTNQAPRPGGLYSQGIQIGNLVFLSGQLPINPLTNELVQGDAYILFRQCFKNLRAVCRAAGGDLDNIVKLNVYLVDMELSSYLDEVMSEFFLPPFPARSRVYVNQLSKNASVEIEGIMAFDMI